MNEFAVTMDAIATDHVFADGTNKVVLLADDDPRLRRAVADVLRRLDFGVIECGTAHEAHLVLLRHSVDAVICDIHMPGGGVDLLATVSPSQRSRFVVLTADKDPVLASQVLALGASAVLHKPVTLRSLCDALAQVTGVIA